jgi:DNA repair protein RecO (recombination protein O)
MPLEKAQALVVRTTDWSETSRIATLWTRELGKVRALAKGGRRLKSSFENALDLLSMCSIVLLRKTSGSLDLLTEAQVQERFPLLRQDLSALYAGYYLAELLGDLTQDYDPHPNLFDAALATLRDLGKAEVPTGPRLVAFELAFLRELGYGPALETCAVCNRALTEGELAFSAEAGGMVCLVCQTRQRGKRALSRESWQILREMQSHPEIWPKLQEPRLRAEIRQVLNDYVTYLMGRRPRLLPYLGS